jgi:hypothetical protein
MKCRSWDCEAGALSLETVAAELRDRRAALSILVASSPAKKKLLVASKRNQRGAWREHPYLSLRAWCGALVLVVGVAAACFRRWEPNQLHGLVVVVVVEAPSQAGCCGRCCAPGEDAEVDGRKREDSSAAEGSRGRLRRRSAAAAEACDIGLPGGP